MTLDGRDSGAFTTYPDLVDVAWAVDTPDWGGYARSLRALTARSVGRAHLALDAATQRPGAPALVAAGQRDAPDDPLVRLTQAAERTRTGWAIRGRGRGDSVPRVSFEAFVDHLNQAETLLIRLAAEDPSDVLVGIERILTARGLELGPSESRRRYDRVAAHDPQCFPAQETLLQNILPKWGGTWDDAIGFARRCAADAPGTDSPALIAIAQLERWGELELLAGDRFLTAPDNASELEAAALASVFHPAYTAERDWVQAHTAFAFCHALAGRVQHAVAHFRVLGPYVHERLAGYPGTDLYLERIQPARGLVLGETRSWPG